MHLRKYSTIDIDRDAPVIFVRHAQSEGQITPSLYRTKGDKNLDLTEAGTEQAQKLAEHLVSVFNKARWGEPVIFSGESLRAQSTARPIQNALGLDDIVLDPRINKQSFGLFDGLLTGAEKREALPDLYAAYKAQEQEVGKINVTPPEGESIHDVIERVRAFLQDADDVENCPIIAVTHGLQMLCADKIINDLDDAWLLDAQDSIANVETLIFHPVNER